MSEHVPGLSQDPFTHATLLNMAAIGEASIEYKPGVSEAGFLAEIASAKHFAESGVLRPVVIPFDQIESTLDIIVKRVNDGQVLPPRWQLAAENEKTVGDVVHARGGRVLQLARQIGMQRIGKTEDYSAIDPNHAVFAAESGANKTSAVRRAVAERAMRATFGDDLHDRILFQFGSSRPITPYLTDRITNEIILDKDTKQPKPNPEFNIIRALAPELHGDEPFTEFHANVATALADGYYFDGPPGFTIGQDMMRPSIMLDHDDTSRPSLCLIQPDGKGLAGGLDALVDVKSLVSSQIIVASNGQYRPKNRILLQQFANRHPALGLRPGVAIGDEPGDSAPYALGDIKTPERPLMAYVNELPIYFRAAKELLTQGATDTNVALESILLESLRPDGVVIRLKPKALEIILSAA